MYEFHPFDEGEKVVTEHLGKAVLVREGEVPGVYGKLPVEYVEEVVVVEVVVVSEGIEMIVVVVVIIKTNTP